ncbi:Uncharacterised protein [uncultured archaeon]|nr:Uncharacterised protein [uncultured archaeon]
MDLTDQYWEKYLWAKPFADAEDLDSLIPLVPYKQYLPSEPTHPRAFIPNYVRWAKRKELDFTCPITGWKETDFFHDIAGNGAVRMVGRLTVDHIIPGSLGGMTTDENIQMISEFANVKKGNRQITNQELREQLLSTHKKVDERYDELLSVLRKYEVNQFRMGSARMTK